MTVLPFLRGSSVSIDSSLGQAWRGVTVDANVAAGTATITTNAGTQVFSADGVIAVEQAGSKTWTVVFGSGEVWTVTKKGCGCR